MTRFRADGLAQLMVVLGIVVLAGWGRGAVTLAVAGGVGIAVCGLLRFWARHCLSSVDYQRQLDQHRACFGEDVPLRVAITNDKLLPLPWVSFEDEIKGRLAIRDATIVERGSSQAFTQVLAIGAAAATAASSTAMPNFGLTTRLKPMPALIEGMTYQSTMPITWFIRAQAAGSDGVRLGPSNAWSM
ncbi:MAG TPA: hypothetical protein VKJ83_05130 [Actinomycetota bacterium]|nr:hypothetical protein [Actinomycetota bacterium]